ncbi:MAG: PPOX class F420-dependent oxidoreductase [Actinomycetota bacterium]
MATLSDQEKAVLAEANYAHLTTMNSDGSPQASVVWIDVDGDDILINTAEGRAKARNVRRNPKVAISITRMDNPFNWVGVRGTVVEVTNDGADAHIDKLAGKYLGAETYPYRADGEVRVMMRIRPDRVTSVFM